jgi:Peptidase family M23
MISLAIFVLVFVLNWHPFSTQSETPTKKYHSPLNTPLILAANFGELRSNHFHMGLDFKTEQKEGLTLHSIDEGYIARVTVSPYGYGRVVYINHPGGITSVYAHCQRLTGKLEEKVKAFQMKAQNSEADIYFTPNELPLKIGEIFALSGNTGASRGPHLHFEIRDTRTEEAINPLKLGFDIQDTRAPSLYGVKIYAVDEFGFLFPNKSKEWSIKGNTIEKGKVIIPSDFAHSQGGIGFALNGIDRFNAAENTCGLYGTTIVVNGDTLMHQMLDRVVFSDTRYMNAYTDYLAFKAGKQYHKAFFSIVNPLRVYKTDSKGILKIEPGKTYEVDYTGFDFSGNKTNIHFTLEIGEGELNTLKSAALDEQYVDPRIAWEKSWDGATLHLPVSCAFEPILKTGTWNGNVVVVSGGQWPVQKAFTVRLKARTDIPKDKQYLAVVRSGSSTALTTSVVGDMLEAKSRYFGEISVQVDTTGPNIQAVNLSASINSAKTSRLVWKMGDYRSGLMNYGLWIDGVWRVLDYESKGDFAFFELKDTTPGPHELKIEASDFCGNTTTKYFSITIL